MKMTDNQHTLTLTSFCRADLSRKDNRLKKLFNLDA